MQSVIILRETLLDHNSNLDDWCNSYDLLQEILPLGEFEDLLTEYDKNVNNNDSNSVRITHYSNSAKTQTQAKGGHDGSHCINPKMEAC